MPNLSQESREELLAQARHMRDLADGQLDPRLRDAALELAEEYERRAAEAEGKDQG